MPSSPVPYSYHDYLTAWFHFMLHQNESMSHSWFVNFDKNFNSRLPLWFSRWWNQFGSSSKNFPNTLMDSLRHFTKTFRVNAHGAKFPPLLHFIKKYKVPWIIKWRMKKKEMSLFADGMLSGGINFLILKKLLIWFLENSQFRMPYHLLRFKLLLR